MQNMIYLFMREMNLVKLFSKNNILLEGMDFSYKEIFHFGENERF